MISSPRYGYRAAVSIRIKLFVTSFFLEPSDTWALKGVFIMDDALADLIMSFLSEHKKCLEDPDEQAIFRSIRLVSEGRVKKSRTAKSKPLPQTTAASTSTRISFRELVIESPSPEAIHQAFAHSDDTGKNKENEPREEENEQFRETEEEEEKQEMLLENEKSEFRPPAIRSDSEPFSDCALEEAREIYKTFSKIGLTRDKNFDDAMEDMWQRLACREGVKLA